MLIYWRVLVLVASFLKASLRLAKPLVGARNRVANPWCFEVQRGVGDSETAAASAERNSADFSSHWCGTGGFGLVLKVCWCPTSVKKYKNPSGRFPTFSNIPYVCLILCCFFGFYYVIILVGFQVGWYQSMCRTMVAWHVVTSPWNLLNHFCKRHL